MISNRIIALLGVGLTAVGFLAASLIPPMAAHAQGVPAVTATTGVDWTFILAVAGVVLGGLSAVLHVIAPRTKNTVDDKIRDDIDEVLAFVRGIPAGSKLQVVPSSATSAQAVKS